ncbi:FAD-binding oxidoreductase [Synechococcus sp. 'PEA 65AY6A-5F PE A']|uniref:FAD-binding oxidoreductase n=1 Tax=Synechococcus sp. 'PEA 65AY6A-5F PE A' TaxID=1504259 RepID=UPI0039C2988A
MAFSPPLTDFLSGQAAPIPIQTPSTVPELAQLLKECRERKVLPLGQGSKWGWAPRLEAVDLILSTRGLRRLIDHAAADLTATVEAGMTLGELQAILAERGQWWPVDPLYPDWATVGGIVATADTGSLRWRYGGIGDLLLGITWVRADGEVAKAGGRVVKNVAGYNLTRLFAGSLGSLGILTQATLRLYPLPAAQATLVATGSLPDLEALARQVLRARVSPVGVDLWLKAEGPQLCLHFHGSERVIAQQMTQVQQLAPAGLSWQEARPEAPPLPSRRAGMVLAKFGCLPSQSLATLEQFQSLFPDAQVQLHRGCGLGRAWISQPEVGSLLQLQRHLKSVGGFLLLLEAPAALKTALAHDFGPTATLMRKLKQQFDPAAIFSPSLI